MYACPKLHGIDWSSGLTIDKDAKARGGRNSGDPDKLLTLIYVYDAIQLSIQLIIEKHQHNKSIDFILLMKLLDYATRNRRIFHSVSTIWHRD